MTIKERLELFRRVCSAVQYAHQNLVVHRDLKPSNILVAADGTPKLLDFGIAKILNPDVFAADAPPTATAVRMMTPEYASPEQVRGEPITTASDTYSLGVVLYELLTGQRPYRFMSKNQVEIYRVISDQEPGKPSTAVTKEQDADTGRLSMIRGSTPEKLRKQLCGDLDNIILMAMRKEPQRRYASADAFSEDIRRFLEAHPVQARKGTWSYRSGKYIRRHKVGVIAAAVVFLLLVAFAITTTFQNIRIAKERDAAQREKQKAEKVTEFLVDLFEVNDPAEAKGKTITAREVLDKGAQKIRTELKDQPDVQAKLMDAVGMIYLELGLYDEARPLLEEALKIRLGYYSDEHVDIAESLDNLGRSYYLKGQYYLAEVLYREGLAMRRKLLGNEHSDVAESLNNLANLLKDEGQYEEAEKLIREALAVDRKLLGNEHSEVAESLNNLADTLFAKGQSEEAEKLFREALAMDRKLLGNEHPRVATDLNNLAVLLYNKGQYDEAEKLYREALAMRRKLLGSENPDVATDMNNLAGLLQDKGQFEEAEKLYREALAMDRKLLGNEHPEVAIDLNNLANLLYKKGQYEETEKLYREALAMDRKLLRNEHPFVAERLNNLANVLYQEGQYDEAEKLYREALAMNRKVLGNEHPSVAASLAGLAEVLVSTGQTQGAVTLLNEALAIPKQKLPEDSLYRARAKSALGACLIAQRKYPEAETLLLDAYKILSVQEKGSKHTQITAQRIIDLYKAWGKPEKAEAFRRKASG